MTLDYCRGKRLVQLELKLFGININASGKVSGNSTHNSVKAFLKSHLKIFRLLFPKGPFKYYVIKEVGGWDQKMAILDDVQYCKSSKSWVGGPKKVKNMMT